MFPMYFFVSNLIFMFPIYFYVSNLHCFQCMFPIYILPFQSAFFVSNLITMFPMYFFCFQSNFHVSNLFLCFQSALFPMYVSNPHITFFLIKLSKLLFSMLDRLKPHLVLIFFGMKKLQKKKKK